MSRPELELEGSAHAPVNGGPGFPGAFLGHFWFCFVFFFKIPNSHSLE